MINKLIDEVQMSVRVSWYDDAHTILYYKFESMWKLDDLFAAISIGREMVVAEDHLVDSIFDFRNSTTVPQQMLASVRSIERVTPPNLRYSVAVGMNALLKTLAGMVSKAAPLMMRNFKAVDTLEEALAFLREVGSASTEA